MGNHPAFPTSPCVEIGPGKSRRRVSPLRDLSGPIPDEAPGGVLPSSWNLPQIAGDVLDRLVIKSPSRSKFVETFRN